MKRNSTFCTLLFFYFINITTIVGQIPLLEKDGEARVLQSKEFISFTRLLDQYSSSFRNNRVPIGYYTVAQLNTIADSLAVNFPLICSKHLLGNASDGSPIYALKISDNTQVDEIEPALLFDGGIHGDEIGGSENLIRFARDLCTGYGVIPEITFAVDNAEIWIIYCLNPYGRDNMTRYNAVGVDINRDCGYMWNNEGSSNGIFSQPETKILRNLLLEHRFVIHISHHSGVEYISYPWSYRADLTPDNFNHGYLAQQYSLASGYENLRYGAGNTGMYQISGSTKDFGYGSVGVISWSLEISVNKQPHYSLIVPYYLKNKPAMLEMINLSINQGISGVVVDAITGEPIKATIFIDNLYPINTTETNGDYHKFLVAGTYNIRIEANGYQSQTINNVVINPNEKTVVNVSLQKGGGYYATTVVACQIINGNPYDQSITPASLGAPDSIAYSIGRNGLVIIDMGIPILNRPGFDVKIFENDNSPEGYNVFASEGIDGPWKSLGSGVGNASFDLSASSLTKARYIKITDDGDGLALIAGAGFELDAVENLHPDTLKVGWVKGVVYNNETPIFTITGATIDINNKQVISDETGAYIMALLPGTYLLTASYPDYYLIDTVTIALGDTLNHDLYLNNVSKVSYNKPGSIFRISPVPASEYLSIEGAVGKYEVYLFNSEGVLCYNSSIYITIEGVQLDIANFKSGFYILTISNQQHKASHKIIISNSLRQ